MLKLTPLVVLAVVACGPQEEGASSGPDDAVVTDYGLFLADGVMDPLAMAAPQGAAEFFADNFGHSEAEIEAERSAATAFFEQTYGVDIDGLVAAGRVQLVEYRMDPGADYRVRALPDRPVQAEGWPIDDLALSLAVVDPGGVELAGDYLGITAPPGVLAVTGFYVFDALDADGAYDETVVIRYHSDGVAATSLDGRSLFFCAMESEQLGTGLGRVTSSMVQLDDGRILTDFSNVQSWER